MALVSVIVIVWLVLAVLASLALGRGMAQVDFPVRSGTVPMLDSAA